MGREAKAQKKAKAPKAIPIKLDELEYLTLQNLILKAEAIQTAAQAQVNRVVAQRDAYLKDLAKKYDIPSDATTFQWNDETRVFAFE